MAKFIHDNILDNGLNHLKNNGQTFILCAGQPATYADATTLVSGAGNKLGDIAIGPTDFTLANGDTSGRKVTVGAQTGVVADEGGTCDHFAIVDDTNTTLLLATPISPPETLTATNSYNTNAFDEEIADAS